MNTNQVGFNIKKIRQSKNITQIKLAERVGISRTYISDIERGAKNPRRNTFIKIADVLEVDISKTLGDATIAEKKNI